MKTVLLGPPGVGKGTQAASLSQQHGWPHISTGNMLRDAVAAQTPVGLEAKRYMDAGGLAPDDVVIRIVQQRLAQPDCQPGFILDGFPRTVAQAAALDAALAETGGLDAVVFVNAPDAVLVRRLSGRRTCRSCGAIFHVDTLRPKVEGVCDRCGGELYQREDDQEETIRQRLHVYQQQTAPLIDYYRDKELLAEVPGERDIDTVQELIERQLARTGAT